MTFRLVFQKNPVSLSGGVLIGQISPKFAISRVLFGGMIFQFSKNLLKS